MEYWCDDWNDNWVWVFWSEDYGCYRMQYSTVETSGRCCFDKNLFEKLKKAYNMHKED